MWKSVWKAITYTKINFWTPKTESLQVSIPWGLVPSDPAARDIIQEETRKREALVGEVRPADPVKERAADNLNLLRVELIQKSDAQILREWAIKVRTPPPDVENLLI
jgi:hypothetical protein